MNIFVYILLNSEIAYRCLSASDRKLSIHKVIPKIKDIPYHVLIVYNNLYCSGSLIGSKIVVTAATCLHKYSKDALVKVGSDTITGFGISTSIYYYSENPEFNLNNVDPPVFAGQETTPPEALISNPQVIAVKIVKIHEYFKHQSDLDNDIALIGLEDNVEFGESVQKVPLIEPDTWLNEKSTLQVSGWGGNNLQPKYDNSLILSQMVIINQAECKRIHGTLITPSNFCASYKIDQRLSDNGGGAINDGVLVGVLSYGATKKEEPMTAVFTNISYFYRWINMNTVKLLKKYCAKNKYVNPAFMNSNEYN